MVRRGRNQRKKNDRNIYSIRQNVFSRRIEAFMDNNDKSSIEMKTNLNNTKDRKAKRHEAKVKSAQFDETTMEAGTFV